MGKKKGSNRGKTGQTGAASALEKMKLEVMKPFINKQVDQQVQKLGYQLNQQQLQTQADLMTRLNAIENLLGLKEEAIANEISNIEDAALGFTTTDAEALEGDTLRVSVRTKGKGEEEFSAEPKRMQVNNLGLEPFVVSEFFEKQLLNMLTGDVKVIPIGNEKSAMDVEVTVDRVSTLIIPKPKLVETEGVSDASGNA